MRIRFKRQCNRKREFILQVPIFESDAEKYFRVRRNENHGDSNFLQIIWATQAKKYEMVYTYTPRQLEEPLDHVDALKEDGLIID